MRARLSDERAGIWLTVPGLAVVAGLMFYPIAYTVYVSLLKYNNVSPTVFTGFDNYRWLLSSSDFTRSWKVSAIYAAGSSSLTLALGLCAAHSLYKITRGRVLFRTLVILPWAVPLVIAGLIFEWMLNEEIGIINYVLLSSGIVHTKVGFTSNPNLAMLAGIWAASVCYLPFLTLLVLAGLMGIPPQLYEAAEIDGAGVIGKFLHVSLPLNRHQIIVAFLIILMYTFRTPDIFFSLTAGGPGKYTYHAGIFLMDTIYKYLRFGRAGAISMMLFLTLVAVSLPILYFGIMRRQK